ncbi:MAG: hypothetical protein HY905_21535 [Deltaproteobacteria bacterium]|nr:hypothetical protein [Deltaproteobacteria bacterium]
MHASGVSVLRVGAATYLTREVSGARAHGNRTLRGLTDIRRWLVGNFGDDAEWREIPREIELCPGVIVRIR